MIIFNSKGIRILTVEVDDNSYRSRRIMGDHNLTLYFSLAEHVEIPMGAYCDFGGERFTLERPENLKMKHSRSFDYTVVFESPEARAKRWKFRNTVDGRLKFSLTAKPREHLQMFVDNMNRRDSGWTIGKCIDGAEFLVSYDHVYCLDALGMIAEELNTEYEFQGKEVSLRKVQYNKDNPLPLSYGRGNGFKPNVGRTNQGDTPPVEILFVQGGSENIDASKYGRSELILPAGQIIGYDGEKFSDQGGFDSAHARYYIASEDGLSIRRNDRQLSSLTEDSLDCSELYPKRIGKVSSVVTVDEKANFYDFIDDTIPAELNYEDCLIEGEAMTVIFQSGMLAGREFEVKYYHHAKGGKAARRFEIVPTEIDGQTMPNKVFKPQAGNDYAIFKCMLPDAYIRNDSDKSGASWDMFREAVRYLYEHEESQFTFSGELDGIWAKKDWNNIGGRIVLGGYILFSDERFQREGVPVRIMGIKDYINKPHSPEIELSNAPVGAGFSSRIHQIEGQKVIAEDNHRASIRFTQRRFRDAKETISMLEEALLDNFTNSINPLTVQTMSMLVGDESLQFRFVNNVVNPQPVAHVVTYNEKTKILTAPAGIVQHLTIGIGSLSSSHKPDEYRFWNVSEFISAPLTDGDKNYYLYIRANRTDGNAVFRLSEKAIKMEAESNYYYLLVGVLNKEYDGGRSFATLYSFTEILPGRVTTERVVSSDGKSFFDLVANAMKLGNVLDFNSNGDGKMRLRGTLVQSESGVEEYLGCYRGVYNSSYTYYRGDEVSYTYQENISTYRYVYETPTKGVPPTNEAHWQIIAQGTKGDKGADGTSVTIKGTLESEADLPAEGKEGDAYIIAGDLYVWNAVGKTWTNVGSIKGDKGDPGVGLPGTDGKFTELRFAVNGSTTQLPHLDKTAINPSGWSTVQPSVSKGQYLWVTFATKSGDGKTLETQWTTPTRLTPYDGVDGENGSSPVMVYRGYYDKNKTYYGNAQRRDCVKYGNTYYITRVDAGTFVNFVPVDKDKWNSFGASFESIATNLLLAEGANIGDWFISDGKIVSTLETGDIIELDAVRNRIRIQSKISGGSFSTETNLGSEITLDAALGCIEARSEQQTSVSYISPTGVFANHAGTRCLPASTGKDWRAAVVGLGFGKLNASQFGKKRLFGVYGDVSNSGTAKSFGGAFRHLLAMGLTLNTEVVFDSGVSITSETSFVMGLGNKTCNIYLPTATREGQIIFFKQWWSGTLRVYPSGNQVLYDDTSENTYYDFHEGWGGFAVFIDSVNINGNHVEAWIVNRFKF